MANPYIPPQPGDVADERGKFASGEEAMGPDPGADASAAHGTDGEAGSRRRPGTRGAAIEDLADPDADANRPDPSKPIAMGASTRPDRGRDIPGGGYGDSRDAGDRGPDVIRDEELKAPPHTPDEIRSGSHLSEDDTRGRPPGSDAPVEDPPVDQPANVTRSRRP